MNERYRRRRLSILTDHPDGTTTGFELRTVPWPLRAFVWGYGSVQLWVIEIVFWRRPGAVVGCLTRMVP
jgi:hypothetical protein